MEVVQHVVQHKVVTILVLGLEKILIFINK